MKKIILLFLPFFLYACSFGSTLYNNFDYVVLWQISDYVRLDKAQKQHFQKETNLFIKWHRQYELPKYHQLTRQLFNDLSNQTLTLEKAKQYQHKTKQLQKNITTYLKAKLPNLLAVLTDKQYKALLSNLTKKIKKNALRSEKERLKALIENKEEWYGQLNPKQHMIITGLHNKRISQRGSWKTLIENWLVQLELAIIPPNFDKHYQVNTLIWTLFEQIESLKYNEVADTFNLWSLSTDTQKKAVLKQLEELQELIEDCLEA